jgi:hypothetical protein
MIRVIGNAMSLMTVGVTLGAAARAVLARELGPLEGIMFWNVGLLALAFFGLRLMEAATPATVSILGKSVNE